MPVRFVKEEVIDDSKSADFRKMVRGEKQIAGPECGWEIINPSKECGETLNRGL